jgi:putative Mg2+ transporter-C (MgtC) family protein
MENFLSPHYVDLYVRLIVAMLLGLIIGTERVVAHKTVSMRTYSMVSMGAALFVIISITISKLYPGLSFNGAYIPAAIITGVGFIGSGVMVWQHQHLMGVTSAAGLWVAAGIGIACGFGFYPLAIVATALILFVFVVLWFIEMQVKKFVDYTENKLKK